MKKVDKISEDSMTLFIYKAMSKTKTKLYLKKDPAVDTRTKLSNSFGQGRDITQY
jgi:uncharacterized protein YcgL (UPF0745 family)